MGRTPKIDPNIYQVDLVAGLFGAFMLVWISGAQETEFPGDQIDPPTFAVLEMTAIIDDGGTKSIYSLVPADAADASCLTRDYISSIGLGQLSNIYCTNELDRRFGIQNVAYLALVDGADCEGTIGTFVRPWPYTYSLVVGSVVKDGFRMRGVFERSRAPGGEIMPFFQTSPIDPSQTLREYIDQFNQESENIGSPTVACNPLAVPVQAMSLYIIDTSKVDVWQSSDIMVDFDFTSVDHLIVKGQGKNLVMGGASEVPVLWNIPTAGILPTKWDKAELSVRLCAYRDGSKRCFGTSGVTIAATTLTLAIAPDA